jgi:hypothetical protein
MSFSVSAKTVRFDEDSFWVELSDGRVLGVPLVWFPRLLKASPAERQRYSLSTRGIHWEQLDEDIHVESLLAGLADRTRAGRAADAA